MQRVLASLVVIGAAVLVGCGDNAGSPAGPADAGGGGGRDSGSGSGSDGGIADGGVARPGVVTYIKAANADPGDTLGSSVALSADGSTLAVGAPQEASSATGTAGDPGDNTAKGAGAVYVFVRAGETWKPEAYLKASNTGANDQFGASVALSADGSTLAVGATEEDSGDPRDPANDAAVNAGAVYVFTRVDATWAQQAYVKAAQPRSEDLFGAAVALSGDGKTLAVGADGEDGSATGVNGAPDRAAAGAGAAYVFIADGGAWTQEAYVKASNTDAGDAFGHSVALSSDGDTLAVGAYHEAGGLADNQADNASSNAGAAYVFTRGAGAWTQDAYVKAAAPAVGDLFGVSVSLAGDGKTLAVGAQGALVGKGAAFVFARTADGWSQVAQVKPANAGGDFGVSLALSTDASRLAVGAFTESSSATGVGGSQVSTAAKFAGATYTFTHADKTWAPELYVKASNTDAGDFFGMTVALSGDGRVLAVGAPLESSQATAIDGDQADNTAFESGAVYVYQ